MALKAIVQSLDDVPEVMREHYKDRTEGGYVLQVEAVSGFSLEDVSGLKDTLSSTREKLRKNREKLEAYGDLSPESAKDSAQKVIDMANWTPEEKVQQQIKAREQQLMERHSKEIRDRDTKLDNLKTSLEKNLITTAASAAITRHKGVPELLLPVVQRSVRMVEHNGEFIAQVIDDRTGDPMISRKSGSTDPMSIDEFVEGLKSTPEFGRAFEGVGATGSGAIGSTSAGGVKGKGRLQSKDQDALNRSIEDVAAGKVVVQDY